jgi:hypothetical protein
MVFEHSAALSATPKCSRNQMTKAHVRTPYKRIRIYTNSDVSCRFCASIEKALQSWLPKGQCRTVHTLAFRPLEDPCRDACLLLLITGQTLDAVRQRAPDASEEGCGLVCLRTAVLHRLPFRSEPYTLTLHLPTPEQQPCPHGAQPGKQHST